MYVAYDNKDGVFNALDKDIQKNMEYHCPICGGKVIFKKGVKIQSHFAHAKNCSCEFETYKKESSEHLEAKKDLYEHFRKKYRNVEVEHIFKTGEKNDIQIADVFIKELKSYDGISYIRYSPFVDNFLNYYQGKVFFYGWDNINKKFEFYQIWAHNLKKRNAVCIKTSLSIDEFDVPLDLKLLDKDLTSKLYPSDVENYVYEQIKFDKTVKNKVLSMFYNQHIELNNIPKVIGVNMLEQVLIRTPLVYWQGLMYRFYKEGKSYSELIRIMSNIIEFKDSIYINNIQQGEIFLKVFKTYYALLVENDK